MAVTTKVWHVVVNGRFGYDVFGEDAFEAADGARCLHVAKEKARERPGFSGMPTWEPAIHLDVKKVAEVG